ncbi:extracytoplasmic-function sigma-70 factor [Herbaspirillum rubrisubalbicans]|jgi:RNA polymerase sigma-70 factor (ECF subfamily)|uniref:Extracytoplasmic-function sigma-70 factor n=2 Tax=Herbaspirillum rubrisubalbicans TaxID=80842 RepID=A0ABX9C802_9BURK|nr:MULTISPECIES: RNA polymerase sigma factor [Herbaspirillum]MCP1572601.1 RNA polymerase sigma-70 factor (ECF subfamily) [Herbaspirillum rubrisubalbicans]QJQ01203.1 RNA polymerase sigma factor [Herbaspirillum rubrisubalbicans Os34]RAM67065.1 extracytoplasmic-function sigma-70 factor [Herbaspirillum rubrisubalbicans]RAN49069.1 extracytoplasmic-function sigma-70 factor [Herbaspirillum rubrisubalbicans]
MKRTETDEWFSREILPLENALWRFLRRNSHGSGDEIADLMQEVYVRLYEASCVSRPEQPKAFMFSIARNLLIDRARRSQVVSIEAYADLEALEITPDLLSPERHAIGLQELRLLQRALDELPERCRQVVKLRKIDGLSQREVAMHMGIAEDTVERQISKGIRAMAQSLLSMGVTVALAGKRTSCQNKEEAQ